MTSVENKEQEEELEPPQKDGSQVDAENVTEVNDTTAISVEMPVDQQGDGNATADVNDTQTVCSFFFPFYYFFKSERSPGFRFMI